jgi:hypothetical protein
LSPDGFLIEVDLLELKLCSSSCTFLRVTEFTRYVPLLTAWECCFYKLERALGFLNLSPYCWECMPRCSKNACSFP